MNTKEFSGKFHELDTNKLWKTHQYSNTTDESSNNLTGLSIALGQLFLNHSLPTLEILAVWRHRGERNKVFTPG